MIKTLLIVLAASASLGASTPLPSNSSSGSAAPAHIEITAGPLSLIRDDGQTQFKYEPAFDSILRIKIGERKSLNIEF